MCRSCGEKYSKAVAYPGGCFGCSSTPLYDRIHSFVSATAQDCIYAKVAPPTRKRFGYKQHANCSTVGGRAKMLRPSVRYAMPFFRAATAKYARLRELRNLVGQGTSLSVFLAQRGHRGSEAHYKAQVPRLKRLTDLECGAGPSTSFALIVRASPISFFPTCSL